MPNKDTLTKSIATLELVAKKENKVYWDILFNYDPGDIYGASAHNIIINHLMVDYDIFEELSHPPMSGFIDEAQGRFGGIIPYLFEYGYNDLYDRVLNVITAKLMDIFTDMLPSAISLLNFFEVYDKVLELFKVARINPKFKEFNWNGQLKDICKVIFIKEESNDKSIFQVTNLKN